MGDDDKKVFLSYRRQTSTDLAMLVYRYLREHGYDVFLDLNTLNNGEFESIILHEIAARPHFVVLLAPGALDRCVSPDDWLRREFEEALRTKRNIVPILAHGVDLNAYRGRFGGDLEKLFDFNGLPYHPFYAENALEILCDRFLRPRPDIRLEAAPATGSQQKAIDRKQSVTEEASYETALAKCVGDGELTPEEAGNFLIYAEQLGLDRAVRESIDRRVAGATMEECREGGDDGETGPALEPVLDRIVAGEEPRREEAGGSESSDRVSEADRAAYRSSLRRCYLEGDLDALEAGNFLVFAGQLGLDEASREEIEREILGATLEDFRRQIPPGGGREGDDASAHALHVPEQFATIQDAVDAAETGETVVVAGGTYRECLFIDREVTLQGAEDGGTRIVPDDSGDQTATILVVRGDGAGSGPARLLDLHVAGSDRTSGILLFETPGIVENVVVEEAVTGVEVSGSSSDTVLLSNCLIRASANGILVYNEGTAELQAVRVEQCRDDGINVMGEGCRVVFDECESVENQFGIVAQDGAEVTIRDCRCEGNRENGILVVEANASVASSLCRENQLHGICFEDGSTGLANRNRCEENGDSGIAVFPTGCPGLTNNVCSRNRQFGIFLDAGVWVDPFSGNVAEKNGAGHIMRA